jgi:hypothetical protein
MDTDTIDALGQAPFDGYAAQVTNFLSILEFVKRVGKLHTLSVRSMLLCVCVLAFLTHRTCPLRPLTVPCRCLRCSR